MLVGVISDTHGLLRPEAVQTLEGCALIVHAGDVGSPDVLSALKDLAPVHAVRGNIDQEPWARSLPPAAWVSAGKARFYVLHQLPQLDPAAIDDRCAAVIYGHSHKPSAEYRGPVLYLNPGSAGPRRFRLPVTLARIEVAGASLAGYEIVTLA
jgi:putative phosphoesterase